MGFTTKNPPAFLKGKLRIWVRYDVSPRYDKRTGKNNAKSGNDSIKSVLSKIIDVISIVLSALTGTLSVR